MEDPQEVRVRHHYPVYKQESRRAYGTADEAL